MKKILPIALIAITPALFAASDESTLNSEIIAANLAVGDTPIDITATITRTAGVFPLRPVGSTDTFGVTPDKTITIAGSPGSQTYDGGGPGGFRGFFLRSRTTDITDIDFTDCEAYGGNGGTGVFGGGAGAGLGGALFVHTDAVVTVNNCSFSNCNAAGGDGGSSTEVFGGGGGGGSMNGQTRTRGGNALPIGAGASGSGGGGYGGRGGDGTSNSRGGGGGGLATAGGDGAAGAMNGGDAFGGGGESGGSGTTSGAGGSAVTLGGGGGGTTVPSGTQGAGGDGTAPGVGFAGGGGSGGGAGNNGGNASFGAGGGTATAFGATGAIGGTGGFGGGGGGDNDTGVTHAAGGFGGGGGIRGAGGGGAGFGGAVFVMEGGTLNFTGSLSFSGSSVSGGSGGAGFSGSAGDGSAMGTDIFMMSGSEMSFSLDSDLILLNPIEGNQGVGSTGGFATTGKLTQNGPGMLVLTGDNTYSSLTEVTGGELRINGSVTTDIELSNGTLSGNFFTVDGGATGAVGNLTVTGGILSPGVDGVGTICVASNYSHSGGTLLVDITPNGQSDTILIPTGTTTITGGELEIFIGEGNYIAGTVYTVIPTAVNGQFATVVKSGPNADRVEVEVTYSSLLITVLQSILFEDFDIDPGPSSEVVKCLRSESISPGTDIALVVELLGTLSASEANSTLTTLSPNAFAALEWINARNTSRTANILDQHFLKLCCDPRVPCCPDKNGWVSVYGNLADHSTTYDFLRGFDAHTINVAAGLDVMLYDCFFIGGALIWSGTELNWNKERGSGQVSSYTGALYGTGSVCDCDISFSAQGGAEQNTTKRHIEFATLNRTARASFWSYFATGHIKIARDFFSDTLSTNIFALADYHYYRHDQFQEKGANSIDLNVQSKDQQMMRIEAGALFFEEWTCQGYCLRPYAGLSWIGEFPLHKSIQRANFQGVEDCIMNVTSYTSLFMYGSPTIGFKMTRCNGLSFLGEYKGIFNDGTAIHQIEARFELTF